MLLPFIRQVCISVNSMPLCSHSGTNKNFPVRLLRSHSHFHAESLKPEQRTSVDFIEPKWNVSAIQSPHTRKISAGKLPPQACGVNPGWSCGDKGQAPRPASPPPAPPSPALLVPCQVPCQPPWCGTTGLSFLLLNGAGTWLLLCQNGSRDVT